MQIRLSDAVLSPTLTESFPRLSVILCTRVVGHIQSVISEIRDGWCRLRRRQESPLLSWLRNRMRCIITQDIKNNFEVSIILGKFDHIRMIIVDGVSI